MGRPISEQRNIGGLSHTAQRAYNLGGEVTTTTFSNNWTFTSEYDAVGNLV
ncbi:MAG: hypothetical protein HYX74_00070 [Acidobacteria bacterium]|nr:hypothetical protein [Acidobacteriota bacterium]